MSVCRSDFDDALASSYSTGKALMELYSHSFTFNADEQVMTLVEEYNNAYLMRYQYVGNTAQNYLNS